MSCSAVSGPAINTVYYDQGGVCYPSLTSTTSIDGVNLSGSGTITVVFKPQSGVSNKDLILSGLCGTNNSATNVNISGNSTATIVATFTLVGTGDSVWGWDFLPTDDPSQIVIKVRVRRTSAGVASPNER